MKTLREWRVSQALGMDDLAKRAGVSKTTILHIEQGKVREMKFRTVRRLCDALRVQPGDVTEFAAMMEGRSDE